MTMGGYNDLQNLVVLKIEQLLRGKHENEKTFI